MIRQIPIAIGIVLLLAASGSAQTVRYVDANADQTPHDGSDWGHAYLELYDALAVASSGDTIRVADGIYKPTAGTDRAATFQLIDGVTLEGGYAGCGAPDPDARDVALYETILSGDIGTPGANSDNCYHVVRGSDLGPTTVLDGFTVTAGNSNHPDFPDNCGGGMRTDNASLTVTNCTFTENASGRHGAGAILAGGSPTMTNCTFSSNTAVLHGGAMFVDSNDLVVANCTFHDNASWKGAGMHVSSSTPTVTNCTFTDNSAQFHGGGLYLEISSATVTNCILWGNTASDLPEIALWGACGITVSYSDIQGGWTGAGNIDADPLFLDADGGDLRLGCSSPCIDAADNNAVSGDITIDLAGKPRFVDDVGVTDTGVGIPPIVDMGAFERQTSSSGGTTIFVPDDFTTIQGAINAACTGDEIVVSPGTYNEAIDFVGKAITLRSAEGRQVTTIDATGLNSSVVRCASGEGPDAVLEGFTITGGTGTDPGDGLAYGGGMYNVGSSPTVNNCIFTGNTTRDGIDGVDPGVNGGSAGHGGGIFNSYSSPVVTACIFEGNSTGDGGDGGDGANGGNAGNGPGIYNDRSSPVVTDCVFQDNTAGNGGDGGAGGAGGGGGGGVGMCNWTGSAPTITDCIFEGNTAGIGGNGSTAGGGGAGGGMYNHNGSAPTATNCIFIGNSSPAGAGGGIYNRYGNLKLTNCTFTGNAGGFANGLRNAGNTPVTVDNCVFWGDAVSEIEDTEPGTVTVTYSDVEGGYTGATNIDADPLFLDPAGGDPRLGCGSPCTDAGDNAAVPGDITTDLAGEPRFVDDPGVTDTGAGDPPIVDMGAYEQQLDSSGTLYVPSDYGNIQGAIAKACAGAEIVVSPGTYNEAIDFAGKAVTLRSAEGHQATTIDATGLDASVVTCVSGEGPDTVLDGFTITGGTGTELLDGYTSGGGMFTDGSSPTVTNCTFTGNSATHEGGGMYNRTSGSPTVTNCTFSGNTAGRFGGGMAAQPGSSPSVINCLFTANAALKGAGIYVHTMGPMALTNCTFNGNTASHSGGAILNDGSTPTVTNCILWSNSPEQIAVYTGSVTVSYSDIQGGWTGTGNIDDDPMLDVDGVHLLEGSPCINAGDPEGDYTDQADIDGEERVQQCRVEMGADETPFFVEDCNGNGLDDVECDLAEGTSLDCNSNVVPDECDIAAGTSLDCQPNDVPDECDLAGPTSDDVNGNGIPDECDLTEPLEPAYPDNRQRNRYIAFAVNKATMDGLDVAFKITLNSLVLGSCDSSGVPDVEGWACRVDADCRACSASENPCWSAGLHCGAGETCDPTGAVCLNDHTVDVDPVVGQHSVGRSWWVGPEHPTTGVHLMVTEAYRKVSADWANPVIVSDCELVPAAVYEARAVLAGSGPPEIESDPLDIKTAEKPDKFWADCVGSLGDYCAGNWRACTTSADCGVCYNWNAAPTGDPNNASSLTPCITDDDCPEPGEFCGTDCLAQWPPPDGFINFHDINAAVFTFSGLPSVTSTDLPNVDLHGDAAGDANVNPPNYIVNFNDIGLLVKAFEGWPYPYSDPGDCPDVGTWP